LPAATAHKIYLQLPLLAVPTALLLLYYGYCHR